MKNPYLRVALIVLGLMSVFFIGWILTYPQTSDPKNFEYVLWKSGLFPMNLDLATGTMIGDPRRSDLVLGKSESQLRKKFGYLTTLDQASPYLKACYENSGWKTQKVRFIRTSPWMVVFDGDKAVDLVLIKGC